MKRTIRTLTAATMAGAIAFSATPAAHAIEADDLARWAEQGLPEAFTDEAGNYYRLIGGEYVQSELPATAADVAAAPKIVENADGSFSVEGGVNAQPADPAPATALADLPGNVDITVEGDQAANVDTEIEGVTDTRAGAAGRVAEAKCGETSWYLTKDGKAYVADQKLVDVAELPADAKVRTPESVQADCVFVDTAAAVAADDAAALSPGAIAGIAAAAIGLPIVIAGVTYFLNQDGQTLVGSSDRVNQEPTPEEKAASDRLRAEHAEEIAAQQAAAATRGVEAETGSNTLARTLFALVIASVLGAAAFLAGRRFLV